MAWPWWETIGTLGFLGMVLYWIKELLGARRWARSKEAEQASVAVQDLSRMIRGAARSKEDEIFLDALFSVIPGLRSEGDDDHRARRR